MLTSTRRLQHKHPSLVKGLALGLLITAFVAWEILMIEPIARLIDRTLAVFGFDSHLFAHAVSATVLAAGTVLILWSGARLSKRREQSTIRALRDSQERYRIAMEAAECGIYSWDAKSDRFEPDDSLADVLDLGNEPMPRTGRAWLDRVHPDDAADFRSRFVELGRSNASTYCHEYRWLTANGSVAWLRDRGKVYRREDGRIDSVLGTIENITQLRKDRHALEQHATRLQGFGELAGDILWECDSELRISFASGKTHHYFGVDTDGVLGLDFAEAMARIGVETDPERLEAHRSVLLRHETYHDVELTYLDNLGARRWLLCAGHPLFDEAGNFTGYRGAIKDNTAETLARSATDLHRKRLYSVIENAPMPILFKDMKGQVTYVNAQTVKFAGRPASEIVGKTTWEMNPPDIAAEHQAQEDEVVRSGRPVTRELRHTTAYGTLDLISTKFPLWNPDGEIEGIGVFSFNISELRQKERALKISEERFRDFARSASDWFWEMDENLRFTHVGERFEEVMGVPAEELIGKTRREWAGAYSSIEADENWENLDSHLTSRAAFRDIEYQFTDPSGDFRTVAVSGVPITDEKGVFRGYRGSSSDVTDRRRAQERVLESEQFLQQLTDNLPIWVSYIDSSHRYRFVNAQYERESGTPRGEMIGLDVWVGRSEHNKQVVGPCFHRALKGEPATIEIDTEEPAGKNRTYQLTFIPRWDQGQVDGVFCVRQDITDLRRAEREASARARHLKAVADGVPALIIHLDSQGRYTFANRVAEEWYARPSVEIIGRSVEDILGESFIKMFRSNFETILTGEPVTYSGEVEYPDGRKRTIQARWEPEVREGCIVGMHGFVVDITKQTELEETIRHNQKMDAIGQLTGGIAHDFNNLLLAIQSNLELLDMRSDVGGSSEIASARKAVDRATDLTRRLLAYSRKQPLAPKAIELGGFMENVGVLLRRTLTANIAVRIDAVGGDLAVLADAAQLESALLNLAINARDAMPDGGNLTISTDAVERRDKGQDATQKGERVPFVRISVRDTGAGMSKEVRQKAFDPFYTTKEVGRGTGLGLSTVLGFVEQSGGFVEIESEVGQGTAVHLFLPLAVVRAEHPKEETKARYETGRGTILLVEDDDLVRETTSHLLKRLGYDVVEAASAREAQPIIDRDGEIDLLFCDVVMPGGMSGLDLARHVQKCHPGLPVILASGYSDTETRKTADRGEGIEILQKPYNSSHLSAVIAAAMSVEVRETHEVEVAAVN